VKATTAKPYKYIPRLLIDASSIIRMCHYAGTDEENGYTVIYDDKEWKINSALHAYDVFIQNFKSVLENHFFAPFQVILVKDGYDSRDYRRSILASYKAKRAKRPKEMEQEFNQAVKMIEDLILSLGGIVIHQDRVEADDVLAYLAQNLDSPVMIWTRDRDMLALVDERTDVLCGDEVNPIIPECPEFEWIPVFKALVGDQSDNLPGAKGFGKKAFLRLVQTFGPRAIDIFRELLETRTLHRLAEDVADFPALQKILDNQNIVYKCWECVKFHPELVNTLHRPWKVRAGYVQQYDPSKHPVELREYYGRTKLVTVENYYEVLPEIQEAFERSLFTSLDIEASTPPESDAWCKAIENSGKKGRKKEVFDTFGFELTGLSITCGSNLQYTYYFSVDHKDTQNCSVEQVHAVVRQLPKNRRVFVHNSSFELPVLYTTWGERELDNGFRGFLPNVWDTVIMKQYVDENTSSNLKDCSRNIFRYNQVEYETVTGGKKMNELSAEHVLSYACDDTIMTAALANYTQLFLELENVFKVWEDVEFYTQYVVAASFVNGIPVDNSVLDEMEAEDDEEYAELEHFLHEYLIAHGWPGSEYEEPDGTILTKLKYWFKIIYGVGFTTRYRIPAKVADACAEAGAEPWFAAAVASEEYEVIAQRARELFKPQIKFSVTSNKDMEALLYGVMGLPIRLCNRPTERMIERGQYEGNPRTDVYAVQHALKFDAKTDEQKQVLEALLRMSKIETRRSLFYSTYRLYAHWKDGRIHPNLGQTRTVTGRFAPNSPNVNQIPKKGEGVKMRRWILPEPGHVIMAPDYSGQELRLQADYSRDKNFLSCYIGDNTKDVHSLTGVYIAKLDGYFLDEYDTFVQGLHGEHGDEAKAQCKAYRASGKQTNFASAYGALPPKLAINLVITEDEAKKFLEAKEKAYPGLTVWKQKVIRDELYKYGYTTTKLGKCRHLRHKILSRDKWTRLEAERQGINAKIQGSGAEQTKLTMSRFWLADDLWAMNVKLYMPVHDQLVFSVPKRQKEYVRDRVREMMEAPYADMIVPIVADFSYGPNFGEQEAF